LQDEFLSAKEDSDDLAVPLRLSARPVDDLILGS